MQTDCDRCKKKVNGLFVYVEILRPRTLEKFRLCNPCAFYVQQVLEGETVVINGD